MELKDAGAHVELFERSRLLGGRATSFEVDGHVVDNGQHVFLACCTEFIRFVARAGMQDSLFVQDRFDVVAFTRRGVRARLRAARLPAPFHLLVSFARYRHLSLRGKLQVARALLALRFNAKSASASKSFASWLRENGQGPQAIGAFWEPFMVPALNAPLDRMNAAEAAFVICTAFLSHPQAARLGYSRVPLAQIMESAALCLDAVHRSCAVVGLQVHGSRVAVRTPNDEREFDGIVLAVAPKTLEKLAGEAAILPVPSLGTYEAFAIMDVHLWFEGEALDVPFAALLGSPVQWIFQKAPGYLCCSISAADPLVSRPSAEIVQLAWDEVRGAVPALRCARLLRGAATRNPEGTFLARPDAVRIGPRTRAMNVCAAGAWTATGWPDTMESAVRSGIAAAQALITNDVLKDQVQVSARAEETSTC